MALALVPVAIMISSKKNKESNAFNKRKIISKLDNNFRKSVMIREITDSVHNHFYEYL